MRYEFEKDGATVASVLWEGPGQVSVETDDPSTRAAVDRYLSSEVTYLTGFGGEDLQSRRRDWTPWEFERACRNLARRLGATVKRVQTGPVEDPSGKPSRDEGESSMKVTGAQALFKALEGEDVDIVFGIPGGAILPAYDPLLDSSVRHVLCRHEQGAGHAAEGYAWATGKVGVAMATSGPGGCNLVTALADAKMDSVPIVAITGQVPTPVVGNDAFQEADITGITMPVTKHNFLVTDPGEVAETIREAFHIARTGRPGPVLVDLPKDVLVSETTWSWPDQVDLPGYKPTTKGNMRQVVEATKLILRRSGRSSTSAAASSRRTPRRICSSSRRSGIFPSSRR